MAALIAFIICCKREMTRMDCAKHYMMKTVDGACLHIQFTYATTGRNARMTMTKPYDIFTRFFING